MKLLLTSAGIKNSSIHEALVDLLGKPIAESNALCIPTAAYGKGLQHAGRAVALHQRTVGPADDRTWLENAWRARADRASQHGFRPLGSMGQGDRRPAGERRGRGVPVPLDAGVRSRGSPAIAARLRLGGVQRREHGPDSAGRRRLRRLEVAQRQVDETLGVVEFSIFPHVDHPDLPENTMAEAERSAAPACRIRPTQSTTTPPSKSSMAPSKSFPKGTGRSSPPTR